MTVAVSVSCQPQNKSNIVELKAAGVDRLGIAVDAATKVVFDRVKGKDAGCGYVWETQFRFLWEALEVFGRGNVSTHLIVGLGETEREATLMLQGCVDFGVLPALFAFTPIRGTTLEKQPAPPLDSYRRVQVARFLIVNGKSRAENMEFDKDGKIRGFAVDHETAGRHNRRRHGISHFRLPRLQPTFYNEKPSGPFYNYPKH